MNLSSANWTAIGPAPVNTPGVSLGDSAGRIDVAAPDPGNVDTMYIGASGGGVWKTGVWTDPVHTWIAFTDDAQYQLRRLSLAGGPSQATRDSIRISLRGRCWSAAFD